MERSPLSTYRRWVASPNHQVAGSDARALAARDRQVLPRHRAELAAEAPQPPVISADHVVRTMIRTADRLPSTR